MCQSYVGEPCMSIPYYLRPIQAILSNEYRRVIRIWRQTIFPPLINTSLYLLVFGAIMGKRIGNVHGVSYLAFLIPGLIMFQLLLSAYSSTTSAYFSQKFQRSIEEIRTAPIHPLEVIIGFSLIGVMRAFIVSSLIILVSFFFIHGGIKHPWLLILIFLVSSTAMSMAGLINGMLARTFDEVSLVPTFILTPLIYLGGVFYAPSELTGIWHTISMINPITYIIESLRYAFLGVSEPHPLAALYILSALIIVFGVGAYKLYLSNLSSTLR
jgi:ABC-2 type transport system permease protein